MPRKENQTRLIDERSELDGGSTRRQAEGEEAGVGPVPATEIKLGRFRVDLRQRYYIDTN